MAEERENLLEIDNDERLQEGRYVAKWKLRWLVISNWLDIIAQILVVAASILSFSSGAYDMKELSFTAGCVGTASVALKGFSEYSGKQSQLKAAELKDLEKESLVRGRQLILNDK